MPICSNCGKMHNKFFSLCEYCRAENQKKQKEKRDLFRSQGLCITCGKEREDQKYSNCKKCRDYKARHARENRKRVYKTEEEKEKAKLERKLIVCGVKYSTPEAAEAARIDRRRLRQLDYYYKNKEELNKKSLEYYNKNKDSINEHLRKKRLLDRNKREL